MTTRLSAQEGPQQPKVGSPFPRFAFTNVVNYSNDTINLGDFKNKWLVIDCWSLTCKSCIESFPKIERLHREFSDTVQFLVIGRTGQEYDKGIESIFDRIRRSKNLTFAACFDSLIFDAWHIESVPHIYVIDPQGILRYVTDGRDLDSETIRNLIAGESVQLYSKKLIGTGSQNLGEQNASLFYSSLTEWRGESQLSGYDIDRFEFFPQEIIKRGWHVTMAPLFELYNYAYLGRAFWLPSDKSFYGNINPVPLLHLSDTSKFQYDYIVNVGRGTYNYSVLMPTSQMTRLNLMHQLQSALSNSFGYEVTIKYKRLPSWNIIVSNPKIAHRIRTSGSIPYLTDGSLAGGFVMRNHSMPDLIKILYSYITNHAHTPIIDKTNIRSNLDITFECDLTDFNAVRNALQHYGLDLVEGTSKMKVLLISDPPNEATKR